MPLDGADLDIFCSRIIVIADLLLLLAAQEEIKEKDQQNYDPDMLNSMGNWLTLFADFLTATAYQG